ncbi:MAG: hypothetical protein UW69_C0030G0019, partial [Microgenomates group bacterium GW2011_GWA2_44_7]
MWRRLKSNFGSFEYYFSQLVGLIPALFLVAFWLYVRNLGYTQLTREQIIFYFLFTAPLGFLFFYSFNQSVVDALKNQTGNLWLIPRPTLITMIKRFLLPLLVDALPPVAIIMISAWGLGTLSGVKIVELLFLFGLSLSNYIFLSITMAILSIYLGLTDWIAFFLRFVGVFWSGAYIPLVFLPDAYRTVAAILPFAFGGLPLTVLVSDVIPWIFIANVAGYTALFIFLTTV